MGSFITTASKKVTDIRTFLRDASSSNSIKYVAEKGKKHLVYMPFNLAIIQQPDGTESSEKQLIAISGDIHEWNGPDGKYRTTVCLKDTVRNSEDGIMLNDGTCPICDHISEAWEIYKYRKELEESKCTLSGDERKKHMEGIVSTLADDRKAKDTRCYMYVLIVKYRVDASDKIVMGSDGLPEFDLKVMKLSSSRVAKMQQQMVNAGTEMAGSEIMFEYPNTDDRRLQISQSTLAPVFPDNMLVKKFPALKEKIDIEVSKFEFDAIDKAFPEWAGMTVAEASKLMNDSFEKWERYKKDVVNNPTLKYMEYVNDTPVTQPSLSAMPSIAPVIPGAVVMPGAVATVAAPAPVAAPTFPDVETVFGAAPPAAPTI